MFAFCCGTIALMDPTATFNAMMESFALGHQEDALEHAASLASWLNSGGHAPAIRVSADPTMSFELTEEIGRELCRTACRVIIAYGNRGHSPEP
ncbi:MAG: hypothetical protein AAFX06_08700 [Planctomycetota bacterium]